MTREKNRERYMNFFTRKKLYKRKIFLETKLQ